MFDEDDSDAAIAYSGDDAVEFHGFAWVHSRRGLIEQQELRLRGQRTRHFELALFAIRQVGCLGVAYVGKPHEFQQFDGVCPHLPFFVGFAKRALQDGLA